jgi:NTP pyrophosphatase (non-canonical NTP hydrolase)
MREGDRVIIKNFHPDFNGKLGIICFVHSADSVDVMVEGRKGKYPVGLLSCEIEVIHPSLKEISQKHHKWLKKMGWVGKLSPLEQLMLVVSECGEAANECRGDKPTPNFRLELADIILRTLGLAERYDIDMDRAIQDKTEINLKRKPDKRRKK